MSTATTDNQAILDASMDEHAHQVRLFDEARVWQDRYPRLHLLHAIPNGGERPSRISATGKRYSPEGQRLAAAGLVPGWPDIGLPVVKYLNPDYHQIPPDVWKTVPYGGHIYLSLQIEMKAHDGVVSQAQVVVHNWLRGEGNAVCVCTSWHEAWNLVCWWLDLPENARA